MSGAVVGVQNVGIGVFAGNWSIILEIIILIIIAAVVAWMLVKK